MKTDPSLEPAISNSAPSALAAHGALPHLPPRFATLMVATANVLNLAQPGRHFYDGQDPYSQTEFERKVGWLGERIKVLNADVLAVQEVWDEVALRAAIARSGLQYSAVSVPGAENGPGQHGAQGTPRVGIVTRLKVESIESLVDFPATAVVEVPGLQTLLKHVCKNGFEHHCAINPAPSAAILAEAFETYMGWDVYYHG
jgi:hypothetical protein